MSARVLVVDDILPNVKLLEAKLASEYYDVVTATSGEEALRKVVDENPDIVLLDVMMPGMDGFEVCQKIKSNPEVAHIPVVMVTALTDSADRVRGLESGADDFLSKPVNDTALMARVRSLVRLKMTVDEWRIRENTAAHMGVLEEGSSAMQEPCGEARILLIENQLFEAEKIIETLMIDEDVVLPVEDGQQAMNLVGRSEFELLIVSLNLEGEDGLRLCSHLRTNEKTRSVPILMIGTDEDMPRIAHGLEIGAHDYILRPIDRNELLARSRTQIRRKRFQERLRSNYETSLSMALTDTLTGLHNRRYMEVHLDKLLHKQRKEQKPFCVLMLDIDHFKSVNDTYGHNVGDEILKTFARRLKDNLRSFDLVVRLGGEEFLAILPDASLDMAQFIAERLRQAVADKPFVCSAPEGSISVTTSIGGAYITPETEGTFEDILECADQELYKAKHEGRNRTFFHGIGPVDEEKYKHHPRQMIE